MNMDFAADYMDDPEYVECMKRAEEDYRHAEELATSTLLRLEKSIGHFDPWIMEEEIAALRFLTGIPRERK